MSFDYHGLSWGSKPEERQVKFKGLFFKCCQLMKWLQKGRVQVIWEVENLKFPRYGISLLEIC